MSDLVGATSLVTCREPANHSAVIEAKSSTELSHSSSLTASPIESSCAPKSDSSSAPHALYNDLLCFVDNYHSEFERAELLEILERNFEEDKMEAALTELGAARGSDEQQQLPLSERLLNGYETAAESYKFYASDLKSLPFNMKSGDYDTEDSPPPKLKCQTDPQEQIIAKLVDDVKSLKHLVAKLSSKPNVIDRTMQTECGSEADSTSSSSGYASGLCIDECSTYSGANKSTATAGSPAHSPGHSKGGMLPRKAPSSCSSLESAVQRLLKRASRDTCVAGTAAKQPAAAEDMSGSSKLSLQLSLPTSQTQQQPANIRTANRRITDTPTKFAMTSTPVIKQQQQQQRKTGVDWSSPIAAGWQPGLLTTANQAGRKHVFPLPDKQPSSPLFPLGFAAQLYGHNNMTPNQPPQPAADTGISDWLKTYWSNLMQHNAQTKNVLERLNSSATPPTPAAGAGGLAGLLQLNSMLNAGSSAQQQHQQQQQQQPGNNSSSSSVPPPVVSNEAAEHLVDENEFECDSVDSPSVPNEPAATKSPGTPTKTSASSVDGEVKPYACTHDNCSKTFANKFLLKKHEFIHTGLRPHQCPFCHKKFNRKDNLLRHKKTHMNNALQASHRRRHSTVFGVDSQDTAAKPIDLSALNPAQTHAQGASSAAVHNIQRLMEQMVSQHAAAHN